MKTSRNSDIGAIITFAIAGAEVNNRRKERGYDEVAVSRGLAFLGKFWGLSALELSSLLSAIFARYSDLAMVNAPLVINAVLSFA